MPAFTRSKPVAKSTVDANVFQWMEWLHENFDGAIDGEIAVSTISNGVAVTINGTISGKSTYSDVMGWLVTAHEALEGAEVVFKTIKNGYNDRGELTVNVGYSINFPPKVGGRVR